MPRRMRAPINSSKHILQNSVFSAASGARTSATVIDAVAVPDVTTAAKEVRDGALIKMVYLEYWVTSDDAAQGSQIVTVEKVQNGAAPATYAQMVALNTYDNKRNILFTSQGLTNTNVGVATPVIRQWIAIPKGKQRFALGDKLVISFAGPTNGVNVCGMAIFKEYF